MLRTVAFLARLTARLAGGALALSVLLAAPLTAQQRRSPTDDVLDAIKRAVNDLRYDEAIRLGHDIEAFVPQMRPSQVVVLRQILALAYFPEEAEHQLADSSLRQLAALVRFRPDAELPQDLRWRGLDSLFALARERTFGFAALPDAEYTLTGVEATGDVGVVTTRLAQVRLSMVHRLSGRTIPLDSGVVRDRGVLRLRAHDGYALLLEAGEYDLRIVAVDTRARDSIVVLRRVSVSSSALTLLPMPLLDSARLVPERVAADRKRTL